MSAFDNDTMIHAYKGHTDELNRRLYDLKNIVTESGEPLEGNAFYVHQSLRLYPALLPKQINLYWCGTQARTRLCEIGFNAGHSALLLLLSGGNRVIDFTVFDIGEHKYTLPALSYIRSHYPLVRTEYVEGDSTATMPAWIQRNKPLLGTYDVVHVDGGHSEHCISNDLKNADLLVRPSGIVVVDDTNDPGINKYVDMYLSAGYYKELRVLKTEGYQHRILQKLV